MKKDQDSNLFTPQPKTGKLLTPQPKTRKLLTPEPKTRDRNLLHQNPSRHHSSGHVTDFRFTWPSPAEKSTTQEDLVRQDSANKNKEREKLKMQRKVYLRKTSRRQAVQLRCIALLWNCLSERHSQEQQVPFKKIFKLNFWDYNLRRRFHGVVQVTSGPPAHPAEYGCRAKKKREEVVSLLILRKNSAPQSLTCRAR